MIKWIAFGIFALLVIIVAIGEVMQDKWYEGYLAGLAEYEKMMRKEKADGNSERNDTELH